MDEIQRQHSTFYSLLCITGLWPFNYSILAKVQRTTITVIILCCIIIQFSSLLTSELKFNNIIMTLSVGSPMLTFVARYVGFIYNFPSVRFIYENINTDCNALKNPVEVNILMSNIEASRRVFLILLVCCLGIFLVIMGLSFPLMLNFMVAENESQPYYLKAAGFFVEDRYVVVISVHIAVTAIIGLLIVSCTEGFLAVTAYYACALFKIASYRIQNVIDNATQEMIATKSDVSNHSGIREAVAIHRRSINLIVLGVNGARFAYIVAIMLVIISFGLNLYRCFLAFVDTSDPLEVVISSVIVSIYLAITFLNNHSGQKIIDASVGVFYDTYNTLWYCTPVGMQKLLLMIMRKSSIECAWNLSGLFIPSYQGFLKMMSTSFSYFTVLYSVQ